MTNLKSKCIVHNALVDMYAKDQNARLSNQPPIASAMTISRSLCDDDAEPLGANNVFCASMWSCCDGNAPESTGQTVPGGGRVPLAKKARVASVVQ